jgi:hypothetical protein
MLEEHHNASTSRLENSFKVEVLGINATFDGLPDDLNFRGNVTGKVDTKCLRRRVTA